MAYIFATLAVLILSTAQVNSLKCNEGFNGSLSGIPFFHWAERECSDNSECFIQQLETKMLNTKLKFVIRYGACTSRFYAPLLTCENLFGAESNLDPAVVFNMMPDLDKIFKDILNDFYADHVKQNRLFFSNGKGMEEFIEGIMKFLETMGLNMEKVKPLTKPITEYFRLSFGQDNSVKSNFSSWDAHRQYTQNEILKALGKLDTKNNEIASNLYEFIGNYGSLISVEQIRESNMTPLVENLPGLVKTTLPKSWKADTWYDSIFRFLANVLFRSSKKSTHDVSMALKSAINVSEKYKKYIDIVFDNVPYLVQQMVNGNFTYASTWAAELAKSEGRVNPVTTRLSNSIFKFISKVYSEEMPADIDTLITSVPGLLYSYFPEESKNIDRIYNALSESFESLNFTRVDVTLKETKMSDFLIKFVDKIVLTASHLSSFEPMPDSSKQIRDLFIINFSRTFYNIMTPKYEDQLDTFFNTLDKGFQNFPNDYDIGEIISDLITNLNGMVPKEMKPLLDDVQDLVDVFKFQLLNRGVDTSDKYYEASVKIIRSYKVAFPESKYPDLVRRTIYIMIWAMKEFPPLSTMYSRCWDTISPNKYDDINTCYDKADKDFQIKFDKYLEKLNTKMIDLCVDITFASFNDFDEFFKSAEKAFIDAFPAYGTFVSLMKVLDPTDVKDLLNDYVIWFNTTKRQPMTTVDSFVNALNATLAKITSKLGNVTKELRSNFAPDLCRYLSCDDDLCNTPSSIVEVVPVTKPEAVTPASKSGLKQKEAVAAKNQETTSGSQKIGFSVSVNIVAMFLMFKSMH